ncbi:MAG: SAM-dependent methyltransferase [Lachnospiraceae bacterium]|nr:SAM-dependent methyltransferase [Lachnospiraceae bacterium]
MIKQGNPVSLSKRLWNLADMLSPGGRVADVGCDHGFLDIYLVQMGKMRGALAMDVRKGPLAAAAEHVKEAGLSERIETRLSDGLEAFQVGEAEKLVCAGMGGPLMQRILTVSPEKTESFEEMILQPQSELTEFRAFLREQGYKIVEERIILEDGKYYFPMKVVPRRKGTEKTAEGQMAVKKTAVRQTEADQTAAKRQPAGDVSDASWTDMCDRYGELLIRGKDPLLMQYLKERERILAGILESLKAREGNLATQGENLKTQGENLMAQEDDQKASGEISSRERRFLEVMMEWEILHQAMELMK